jgi:hypothetical protein
VGLGGLSGLGGIVPRSVSDGDPDATAFIAAAATLSASQQTAIANLVATIKAIESGIVWGRLRLIYPFVGATALTHSLNLKNPSQFPIAWNGALTHTAQGVVGALNGDGWGDTGAVPTTNEAYVGLYVNQSAGPYNGRDWGAYNTSEPTFQSINFQWGDDVLTADLGPAIAEPIGRLSAPAPGATGYTAVSRIGTAQALYEGTTIRASGTRTASTVATATFKLFRGRPAGELSPGRTYAFAVAGVGLTQSQHNALFAAIQNYQTTLGRAVAP